uniref:Alpha/beta hydrolase fold-3 domain-containing protein n=1 Tax=Oryza brachyantha TaxID=4533 RepID=J3MLH2_ORYBR
MRSCGGRRSVTLVESEGEDHGFHLYSPLRATSRKLMDAVVQFINHQGVFLGRLDSQARRGPIATQMNSSVTVGQTRVSKRGFGLFPTWAKPNKFRASNGPLLASVSWSAMSTKSLF